MKYYLLLGSIVMRGDDDDVTSFEIFQDEKWEEEFELAWQMLYNDLNDFQEITEQQALSLINQQA